MSAPSNGDPVHYATNPGCVTRDLAAVTCRSCRESQPWILAYIAAFGQSIVDRYAALFNALGRGLVAHNTPMTPALTGYVYSGARDRGHDGRSIGVNGPHIWSCQACGDRWHPSRRPYRDCPGRRG